MATYVALLRGINVGGAAKIAMADLRSRCAGLGWTDVRTYVNSGNVVFAADTAAPRELADALAGDLATVYAFAPAVVVVDAATLHRIVATNPYPDAARSDPTRVHVAFLTADVDPAGLDVGPFEPEACTVGEGVVYLHLPGGMGRSKLVPALSRRLGGALTARNWRTVEALAGLAEAPPPLPRLRAD